MMVPRSIIAAAVLGASLATAPPAVAQDVQLTFNDGLVTLKATNAAIGGVLAKWAQVGGTTVINGDRVPGPPVTLELVGVPEGKALEVLLRGASGYMVAQAGSRGAAMSRFDRIYIVPVSVAPSPVRAAQATPAAGSRARVAPSVEVPEPAESDQLSVDAIGAPTVPAETAGGGRPATGATSAAPPAFGTWRDPGEAARQAATATFGAATASRPGQATAVIPPPRPPGAPPTPVVANQQFDTRRGAQQLEPYMQQIQQQREQQQQQQTAPPQ
jgi:hypothetical protein